MTSARELRFAFVFDDYDAALHLFRDVLCLETVLDLDQEGGRGVILKVPSATLEVFDRAQGNHVDDVEVGRRLDERVRIAIKVADLAAASSEVEKGRSLTRGRPRRHPLGRLQPALLHERWPPADPLPETQLRCVTARRRRGQRMGCAWSEYSQFNRRDHQVFSSAFPSTPLERGVGGLCKSPATRRDMQRCQCLSTAACFVGDGKTSKIGKRWLNWPSSTRRLTARAQDAARNMRPQRFARRDCSSASARATPERPTRASAMRDATQPPG
jgi:lactoylglutathione lyase